jgi:hypothetical protein
MRRVNGSRGQLATIEVCGRCRVVGDNGHRGGGGAEIN